MKKKLLTFMTLLCAIVSAQADDTAKEYLWDFTNLSSTDTDNLSADSKLTSGKTWNSISSGYSNVADLENGKLTTKDGTTTTDLAFANGLTFTGKAEKLKIYTTTTSGHLNLNGITITTPSLKKGQIVAIDCASGKDSDSRIISSSNLTSLGTWTATADRKIYMGYVTADGTVTISVTDAMNFYKISVSADITDDANSFATKSVDIALNEYGVCTYSSNLPLDFSNTGITAYAASAYTGLGSDSNNGKVTLEKVTIAPPYTGLLLMWDETNTSLSNKTVSVKCGVPAAVKVNYLRPSVTETTVEVSFAEEKEQHQYIFGRKTVDGKVKIGFYNVTTSSFNSAANRAYLSIPRKLADAESAAKFIALDFGDGEATGISEVKATKVDDDAYYTLSGVRVAQPRKGLYIKNGKKVIIK